MTIPADRWPPTWRPAETASPRICRVTRADACAGIAAPAKLNLGLAVVGRRTDGYHKLVTLFVTLALADTVRVEPAATLTLVCDDPLLAADDNLCLRAARVLQEATGVEAGAHITLTKRIPVAAGLGGGSSDAAATLRALDALWNTRLSDRALFALARSLGADVPFLLCGGAAIARGIGDILWPAVPLPPLSVVLVVPRVEIPRKTAALYGALTAGDYDQGAAIARQGSALRAGHGLDCALLGNSFLRSLEQLAPAVTAARAAMERVGLCPALSGSGPALYALCATAAEAARAVAALESLGAVVIETRLGVPPSCGNTT